LNCFTGLDSGLSTLDGILTWITKKNRQIIQGDGISQHAHTLLLSSLTTIHTRKLPELSVLIAQKSGIRGKNLQQPAIIRSRRKGNT